jgi:Sec-independent protein translocase protein TatA
MIIFLVFISKKLGHVIDFLKNFYREEKSRLIKSNRSMEMKLAQIKKMINKMQKKSNRSVENVK